MSQCQVKKGIFVLKECGEISGVKCDSCGISVCGKHGKQNGPQVVCPECYAKSHQKELANTGRNRLYNQWEENSTSSNYMLWYFATRHSYYTSSHYRPFEQHDYNSFNKENQNEFTDDKDTGSFFDS